MENKTDSIYQCKAYACYLKDKDELLKSTSGGAFFALAKKTIQSGGVVFGAAFKDGSNWDVWHTEAHDLSQLDALRESKYVQSRIGDSYIKVKDYLLEGKKVLFSGTPCQIAGLHSFLGCEYENLLTVEVICHGVPSAALLRDHLFEQEKVYGKEIEEIKFRDKINGWDNLSVSYQFNEFKKTKNFNEEEYCYCFNMYYSLRPSCYNCKFINLFSGADIMIGDYWGIKEAHPSFWNSLGVSAVILKTERGEKYFNQCKGELFLCSSTVKKISKYNCWITNVKGPKKNRKIFFDDYKKGVKNISKIMFDIDMNVSSKRIGIIGSYSLRKIVHSLRSYDPGISITYQITNSGLCSMFCENEKTIPHKTDGIKMDNMYRLNSLKTDVLKNAEQIICDNKCDYIMIDFMEERYPLLMIEESYYTKSDVLQDIKDELNLKEDIREIKFTEIPFDLWKRNCDKLITILKRNYEPKQIILNRLYLTENIGNNLPEKKFSNIQEIREFNIRLKRYYDYFEENMGGYAVSLENEMTDYCPELFEYGCKPEYFCEKRYREYGIQMINIVEEL